MKLIKLVAFIFFITACLNINAQNSKSGNTKITSKKYPATFSISKNELEKLFTYKTNGVISTKTNKYIDKSNLQVNMVNGDTKFLKVKLAYFTNAFLTIQVNGEYSTQVFILSDDKSVFYKGRPEKDNFILTRCSEDEIVSE